MRYHYERSGQGPDVLLVHGWGLHGGIWSEFADRLQETAHVTCVDLPGHGRSETVAAYTLDELADAFTALCPNPVIAIGWSLGALAVLALARRCAACVRGMVLFGATPRFVTAPDWPCAVSPELLGQFGDELARDYGGTLSRFLTLQLGAAGAERGTLRRLRTLVEGAPPRALGLRAGLTLLQQTDLRSALPMLDVPALIVHGGRDRLVPPAAGAHLAARLPRARLHQIPDAGHAPFLSHTDECVRQARTLIHG